MQRKKIPQRSRRLEPKILMGMALLLALWLILPGLAEANLYTFSPIADAYVCAGGPDYNYDSEYNLTNLGVFFQPAVQMTQRTYLKFFLGSIPATEQIVAATLNLYEYLIIYGSQSIPVNLHYVANDAWGESTITWNNQPIYTTSPMSTQNCSSLGLQQWNVDVSYLTDNRLSLLLKLNEDSHMGVAFFSRENSIDKAPYLSVITQVIPLPGTLLLLSSGLLALPFCRRRIRKK